MRTEDTIIKRNEPVTAVYRRLELDAPGIAPEVKPGQFVHVRLPAPEDALLRRPFSVFKTDGASLEIIYKPIGRGTRALEQLPAGRALNLIGPLGRGFPLPGKTRTPVLVAGGYGMAALYLLARKVDRPGIAFFGGRGSDDILCVPDFEALGWHVETTTEDGSLGRRGVVTAAVDDWLDSLEATETEPELFACGPNGLLRAISDRARNRNLTAWISLDRNMGCGVGACLTCVCRVRKPGEEAESWARCCREGPVFNSRDIVWEVST